MNTSLCLLVRHRPEKPLERWPDQHHYLRSGSPARRSFERGRERDGFLARRRRGGRAAVHAPVRCGGSGAAEGGVGLIAQSSTHILEDLRAEEFLRRM